VRDIPVSPYHLLVRDIPVILCLLLSKITAAMGFA
jgi:hypothetical protein